MSWVFERSRSKKNARLVLLAIADCANDEGKQAYPSMAKLKQKTGLGDRAVTGLVAELEQLGELKVQRNMGPRGCNLYQVVMTPAGNAGEVQEMRDPPQKMHPAEDAPPQETTETPAESAPGTIREPSKNSSSKSSAKASKKSKAPSRAKKIPPDFAATPKMIEWARDNTPLVGASETAQFIDWHTGKGSTFIDWVAAWRTWMRKAQAEAERRHQSRASPRQQPASTEPERIPRDQRCPEHRDQRAGSCRHCAARAKTGDA